MATLRDIGYHDSKCELNLVIENIQIFNYGGNIELYEILITFRAYEYCIQARYEYGNDEIRKLIDKLANFSKFTAEDLITTEKRIVSFIAGDRPPGICPTQAFSISPQDPGFMFYLLPLKVTNETFVFNVIVVFDAGVLNKDNNSSNSSSGPAILLVATHKDIGKFVQDIEYDLLQAPRIYYNSEKEYLEKKGINCGMQRN